MGKSSAKITALQLGNNLNIKDDASASLFRNIVERDAMNSLNLSNCGLGVCSWARFLPFITTLHTLNLSHNNIGDGEFIKLCKGLESCFCLRYLDVSYNLFGGVTCSVIQRTLELNKSIYSINFAATYFSSNIWRSLSCGLITNRVLLTLDVSYCELSLENALVLCGCFQRNDVCSILLDSNPLPSAFIADPRWYCMDPRNAVPATLSEAGSLSSGFLPLASDDASVRCLSLSAQWRTERRREMISSL
jgi:hypothetical protein